jgi:hypothetical protein
MNDVMTVLDLIKQISIAVGVISGSSVLTGLVNAAANIQNTTVKHIISWALPIIVALILCAVGTISFGYGNWDYLASAAAGALVGGASNGLYDWKAISNIIDKFYELFGHKNK